MGAFTHALELYDRARAKAFQRRDALPVQAKVGLSLAMAGLTGLMAQLRLPLPNTPVPVTGQVFAVLLSGVLLGGGYGVLSQVFYVAIGAAGLPWFNGFHGGTVVLLGATGGYLVGFIPAALLVGLIADRCSFVRRPGTMSVVMLLGVAVIYTFGMSWFAVVCHTGFWGTLAQAVVPFIAWDVAKALLAANIAAALLPKGAQRQ